MSCTLSVTYVLFFNKISMIRFYQWKLYSQMLGQKPVISDRQRKAPILSPHTPEQTFQSHSPYTISKTHSSSNVPFLCFLCISLSVLLSPSYSLWFFSPNNPEFTSCHLVVCFISWPMVDLTLFNSTYNIQAESFYSKGVCEGWPTPQLEAGFSSK